MAGHANPPRPRRSVYRRLPVLVQWAIPFTIAAALIVALVAWVHHETNDTPSEAPVTNPNAIVEQNREADILIGQQQAPHVVRLTDGASPLAGTRRAVLAFMTAQVSHNQIAGPLTGASCRLVGAGSTSVRRLVRCTAVAAHVRYPFDGVVQPAAHELTYCREVPPPVPSMRIPVSRRCT